jgi:excisionase family DNA binding protein
MNESIEPLLTVEEVARYLNVHPDTVYRLIKEYHLPAVKIINQWRFRRQDLEKFICEHLTFGISLHSTKPLVFKKDVLDKYINEPEEYYVHDEAFFGKLGKRQDWFSPTSLPVIFKYNLGEKMVNLGRKVMGKPPIPQRYAKPQPPQHKSGPESFVDVFYNKITLQDGQKVIIVSVDEFGRIPMKERPDWFRFEIKNRDNLAWPWLIHT